MSSTRGANSESDGVPIPEDPAGEIREQLAQNDEQLREGDEPTPDETVPRHSDEVGGDEQREKHDEDEQASHLLHDDDLPAPPIEP